MNVTFPFKLMKRQRQVKQVIWLFVMSLLLLAFFRQAVRSEVRLAVPRCHRSYLLSESVFSWEQHLSNVSPSCSAGGDYQESIPARLRRAKASLGRRLRLAIVGDSRGRAIYVNMINVTGHTELVFDRPNQLWSPAELQHQFSTDAGPREFCSIGMCSSNATSDSIEYQFVWRALANRHLSETLVTLAAEYDAGRRASPDMVLVNSGFWYSTRAPFMFSYPQHEQLLMFRQGLHQLTPPLAELARRVHTIWKLEEATLFEFIKDKYQPIPSKTEYLELMLVQQALVYELMSQIPELVIWSSLLPEVTRHMFLVCAPARPRTWTECPDPIHMGKTLQDGFTDLLLSDLSDRALNGALPR